MAKKRTQKHGWGKYQRDLETIRDRAITVNNDALAESALRRIKRSLMHTDRPAGTVRRRKMNTATSIRGNNDPHMRGV